jgi:hypothetical protein
MLALVVSLLGITLGQPVAPLRARFGDPIIVRPYAGTNVASYLRPDDVSAVLTVAEDGGVVASIEIERERTEPKPGVHDAYGIALGATQAELEAKRGKPAFVATTSWYYPEDAQQHITTIYRFTEDGVLESIKLIGAPPGEQHPAGLPHLVDPKAGGFADAVLDLSPRVSLSQHFRERFLAVHDCDPHQNSTTIDRRDGRVFAIVKTSCKDKPRTIYFDITAARP